MLSVLDVLGFLGLSVVVESDSVSAAGGGFEAVVASVLGDFENTPFSSFADLQVSVFADLEELAVVGDVLQLDVLGLRSLVETVDLPGGRLAVTSIGGDFGSVELQVLAGGLVVEVEFVSFLPKSCSCHFFN